MIAATCAALLVSCASAVVAAPLESAVNLAGRQRMLSQRIVKAFCQVGLGVMQESSRKQLLEAIDLFESQQIALRDLSVTRDSHDAIRALDHAWLPFKLLATLPPTAERARMLAARDEGVLAAAQRATQLLESEGSGSNPSWVNLAGRQRMLSQRLAKIYMLQAWGLDNAALRSEADTSRAEFSTALARLRKSGLNSSEIDLELDAVELQWRWFENALSLAGAHAYKLIVADASESIVNSMDRITSLYEQLAPQAPKSTARGNAKQ